MANVRSHVVVVIPVRYGSTRFPGKPLAQIGRKPLVQQIHDRVAAVCGVARVIVATDDERIFSVVTSFGGTAMMTGKNLRTGSDRVAEIAQEVPADVYIICKGMRFRWPRVSSKTSSFPSSLPTPMSAR